jgi:cysteinyl-tRNA synthetase
MTEMDKVFGVFYQVPLSDEEEQEQKDALIVPEDVLDLVGQRTVAKDAKEWDLADSLRQRITELGFKVKDVKDGEPIVSRLES